MHDEEEDKGTGNRKQEGTKESWTKESKGVRTHDSPP